MFLLVLHIVAIGLLTMVVSAVAYNLGVREGERRTVRRIELEQEGGG